MKATRHPWIGRLGAGVLLAVLARAGPPAAQGAEPPAAPEAAVAGYDQKIAEVEELLAREPDHPTAWGGLILFRLFREVAAARMQGTERTAEDAIREATALHEQWIEAQPWNPLAYVGMSNSLPPSQRADYLVRMIDRVADRPEIYEHTLFNLRLAGEADRANRVVDEMVARNRGLSEMHRLAYQHYDALGHRSRAEQILDGWLEALPGDARALELWWGRETGGGQPTRAVAEQVVDRLELSEGAAHLCSRVGEKHAGAWADLAVRCYRKLLDTGPAADERTLLEEGLKVAASRAAPANDLLGQLAGLPPEKRDRALLSIASQRADKGHCEAAVELVESPSFSGTSAVGLTDVFIFCGSDPTFEERLLGVVARLDADRLDDLLWSWPQDTDLGGLEIEVLERLARNPGKDGLYRALDSHYERSGRTEARVELLRAIGEEDADDSSRAWRLAGELTELGRTGEAIAVLERLTASRPGAAGRSYLEKLAMLYLAERRVEDAAAVVERIVRLEGPETRAPRGDLLRARVAWMRDDLETAYDAYRSHLLRDRDIQREALGEISGVAEALGRLDEIPRLLERRYELFSEQSVGSRPAGGLDSWVAGELEAISLLGPALVYLERAIDREPRRTDLRERRARISTWVEGPEETRAAQRALVELDPGSVEHWVEIAESHLREGRPDLARQVADEAVSRLGREEPRLRVVAARAYIEEGRAVEALRVLRAVQKSHPDDRGVKFELLRAYRLLGEQAGEEVAPGGGQPGRSP